MRKTLVWAIVVSLFALALSAKATPLDLRVETFVLPPPRVSHSHHFSFKGFYVGGDLGYYGNIFDFNNTQTGTALIGLGVTTQVIDAFTQSVIKNRVAGNFYLGYMLNGKNLFFGIDALMLFGETRYAPVTTGVFFGNVVGTNFGTPLRSEIMLKANTYRPGLEIRPGITIGQRFAMYFLFGGLYSRMTLTVNDRLRVTDTAGAVTTDRLSLKTVRHGVVPQFGFGILFALSPRVYLTFLDRYTKFETLQVSGVASSNTATGTISDGIISVNKVRVYNNSVLIGLLFRL